MDTMQLKLIFNKNSEWTKEREDCLKGEIESIESPNNYFYCDVKEKKKYEIIIKISFPRFYYGNNAYLVETEEECAKVQKNLVRSIRNNRIFDDLEEIDIMRVDIPFTYYMEEGEIFNSYSNVFRVMALYCHSQNKKSSSKAYMDLVTLNKETIHYADTPCPSGYNKKIMIYDQSLNLKTKLKPNPYNKALRDFPDLKQRIRIEVSNRVKRNPVTLDEFSNMEIFSHYVKKFKEDVKKLVLNFDGIDSILEKKTKKLSRKIREEKKEKKEKGKKFMYEMLILKTIDTLILDYKVIRNAIYNTGKNIKTCENAVTTVNKILEEYEKERNIIIRGTYSKLKEIAKTIDKFAK